ncbi:MAG: hypothetical protein EXR62_11260 [Chloroflexi bacterium]|nr:hypothetical protein [Chloroflexota bacterium]
MNLGGTDKVMLTRIVRRILLSFISVLLIICSESKASAQSLSPFLFPWSAPSLWYFTGGPHGWGNTTGGSGLDFAPPPGNTGVLAAADGQVFYSGWDDWGYGNNLNVRIKHGREETWYLHLSHSIFGESGQLPHPIQVRQGQYLGEVGSTGAPGGVHIHIELLVDGNHQSWNSWYINDWQVWAQCAGYIGSESCISGDYNGYIQNVFTGVQKVPNDPPGEKQKVQSINPENKTLLTVEVALRDPNGTSIFYPNRNPLTPQRRLFVDIYNTNKQRVFYSYGQSTVTYNPSTDSFIGVIDLGNTLPTGNYTVKFHLDFTLTKVVDGIQKINGGSSNVLPGTLLWAGDTNNDNKLNILDWNVLYDCYSDANQPPRNCADSNKKLSADINDDGNVNIYDMNQWLRIVATVWGD